MDDTPPVTPPVSPPILGTGAPDQPTPVNKAPWQQPNLDNALADANQAAQDKLISVMLIAIGIAMIAAGCACCPPNIGLIIAGIMMVLLGIMFLMMAMKMAAMAKQIAAQIQSMNGQTVQSNVVDQCADQAAGNGTYTSNCRPSTQVPDNPNNTQKAADEESNSTYELDNGHPIPAQ